MKRSITPQEEIDAMNDFHTFNTTMEIGFK